MAKGTRSRKMSFPFLAELSGIALLVDLPIIRKCPPSLITSGFRLFYSETVKKQLDRESFDPHPRFQFVQSPVYPTMGPCARDMFWEMRKKTIEEAKLGNFKREKTTMTEFLMFRIVPSTYTPDYWHDPTEEEMDALRDDMLMIFEASSLKYSEKILPLDDFRIPKLIVDTSGSPQRRKLFERFVLEEVSSSVLCDVCNLCGMESLVDVEELSDLEADRLFK